MVNFHSFATITIFFIKEHNASFDTSIFILLFETDFFNGSSILTLNINIK